MTVLVQVLATLFVIATAIAGVSEILGFQIGPLHGPRLVNIWQYGLAMFAGCVVIGFDAGDLKESAKLTFRLLSFPLMLWIVGSFFPVLFWLWQTEIGFFTRLFLTVVQIAVWLYVLYLDVRYLMLQAPPGYFTGAVRSAEPVQPGDE